MAKAPRAGRAKRRLAREAGTSAATRFAKTCLANTLLRLGGAPRWQTLLAITPDRDPGARAWLGFARQRRVGSLMQGKGDLGQRMQRLFRQLPPGPAVIVGSDIPDIAAAEIAKAFRLLGQADAVFGPALDGGYWLVGLRRRPRTVFPFDKVRWSTPHALADTVANLDGCRTAFVATLADVDNASDCRKRRKEWERLIPPRRRHGTAS